MKTDYELVMDAINAGFTKEKFFVINAIIDRLPPPAPAPEKREGLVERWIVLCESPEVAGALAFPNGFGIRRVQIDPTTGRIIDVTEEHHAPK
jgi:hypothetical protein